ncbi:MAG: J domain-containing protein [Pseudomonadota bacterium]
MPTIHLKPNSPDFAEQLTAAVEQDTPLCNFPGCCFHATHRAPKSRDFKDYYQFCLQHVQEYNREWDFFEGMKPDEVEAHILKSLHGDRPTWRYDTMARMERLQKKAWQTYHFTEEEPELHDPSTVKSGKLPPEMEAMQVLGLEPPVDLDMIKKRYKQLVKRYHPDRNPHDKGAEEILKRINIAYTVLKTAYKAYETLSQKT